MEELIQKLHPSIQCVVNPKSFQFIPIIKVGQIEKCILGSPTTETYRNLNEEQREVTFTKPFEMQVTPVTQLEWALVMGNNPSHFTGDNPVRINGIAVDLNRPVEQVSWNDVQDFIKKLNEQDPKYNYRLLTEAEWEYSARAGTNTRYSFGDNEEDLVQYGWYCVNANDMTHPVTELKPNAYGLYDMHGNVWEWVQDGYIPNAPGGVDPVVSSGSYRVLRGGGWSSRAQNLRSALRSRDDPASRNNDVGFRLVRTPIVSSSTHSRCECGADSIKVSFHSSWCPKYE